MDMHRYLRRMIWIGGAPLIGLAGVMAVHDVMDERARVARMAEALAGQFTSLIEEDIGRRRAGLQMLADSPHATAQQLDELKQLSAGYLASFGSHVCLVGEDLELLLSTRAQPGQPLPKVSVPRGQSALMGARQTGQPQVGDVVHTAWGPQEMVGLAVPVVRQGVVSRVLVTTVETSQIQARLAGTSLPEGWRVRVLDSVGRVIAQLPAAVAPAMAAEQGHGLARQTMSAPWRVEVGIHRTAYWSTLAWAAAPVLGGLLAAGALAYAAMRRASRRLVQEVDALAGGGQGQQAITIREIAAVRDRIAQVSAARDEAQTQRQVEGAHLRDELQSRQALLESAVRAMNDGIWIGDTRGTTLAMNQAFIDMHGLSAQEAASPTLEGWIHSLRWTDFHGLTSEWPAQATPQGEPVAPEQTPMRRALAGETAPTARYWVQHLGSGQRLHISYSYAPLHDAQGRVSGTVVLVRDITSMLMTRAELHRQRRELRHLLRQQGRVQELERRRIARELHDDLQQKLAAIRIELATIGHVVQTAPQEVPRSLVAARSVVDSALDATRRIVNDLRPATLDELGLPAALETMLAQFGERTGLAYELETLGPPGAVAALSPELATGLFRIAQESMNNILKHARASTVSVVLDLSSPDRVRLRIDDDGVGLPSAQDLAPGNGLQGMRERALALGGTLTVTPGPQGGTRVEADLPLQG